MKCDPELTALAERVRQTYGHHMLAEAYLRALVAVPGLTVRRSSRALSETMLE
jgi:hypothetical protein